MEQTEEVQQIITIPEGEQTPQGDPPMLGEVKTITTIQAELIRNVRIAPLDRAVLLAPTVAQELVVAEEVQAEEALGVEKITRTPPHQLIQSYYYVSCLFLLRPRSMEILWSQLLAVILRFIV